MKPIKTAECNAVAVGDGADVLDIPIQKAEVASAASFDGAEAFKTFWTFTPEERERIAQGENISVGMLFGIAPHWVNVVDSPEIDYVPDEP